MRSNADRRSDVTISLCPFGKSYQSRTLPCALPDNGRFVSSNAEEICFRNSLREINCSSHLFCVFHAMFEQFQAASMGSATCVEWMLPGMDVIFRVRHQTKYISLRVANACDVIDGAVWVQRIFAVSSRTIGADVNKGNLIVENERRKRREIRSLEVAFTMCDGTFDVFFQSFGPNTVLRNRFERDPTTFEMALGIEG